MLVSDRQAVRTCWAIMEAGRERVAASMDIGRMRLNPNAPVPAFPLFVEGVGLWEGMAW